MRRETIGLAYFNQLINWLVVLPAAETTIICQAESTPP